ncbi:MAG: GyrI-like domain-containing protein [Flavobacteriaceae bacterium]|nr:GyrI-like domain-containing protein [Flavobacteriaceae bacterium]MDG1962930.1 GyrI-like domain-containing protein [Flavobacteriaceae bacterium]
MNKKSVIKWVFFAVMSAGGFWYFFGLDHHYQITFKTKQPPGVVYDHVRSWPIFAKTEGLNISNIEAKSYASLSQQLSVNDSLISVQWRITRLNDSMTKVTSYFRDNGHPIKQKITAPFGQSDFVSRAIKSASSVAQQLVKKTENFRVQHIADTLIPEKFCAYVPVTVKSAQKAQGMMGQIGTVMDYINTHELPLQGDPFITVTNWDQENQVLQFDFCFPITPSENHPADPKVLFKTIPSQKYLMATFNGNYRISQQGWYYLLDHAERRGIALGPAPTEIYLNDPHSGGESLDWSSLLLFPIVNQ